MTGKRGKTPSDEGLMPDSKSTSPERSGQSWFNFRTLVGCLLLVLAINEANWRWIRPTTRPALEQRVLNLVLSPIRVQRREVGPFRIAGAWVMDSKDRAFGGLSGLAFDRGELVAVTDFGSVLRWPVPAQGQTRVRGVIAEIPRGPRTPWLKANWDVEAMLADPLGRGWWLAFEHPGELWLYDRRFERPLERIKVGSFGRSGNAGIEGLAADGGDLLLLAEKHGGLVRLGGGTARIGRIAGARGRISDAAALEPGRLLAIERQPTLLGFRNRLVELRESDGRYARVAEWPLPASPLDNFEGLAIDRSSGGTRLWLVSDDNFQKPFRTVLLALDWVEAPGLVRAAN